MTPLPTLTYPEDSPHVSPIDILLNLGRALGIDPVRPASVSDAWRGAPAVPPLPEMQHPPIPVQPVLVMSADVFETNQDHHHVPTREMRDMSQETNHRGEEASETLQTSDPVNHPRHYTSHPSGIECIEVTRHMSFNIGNAIKYLWRADEKGAPIEDLRKAIWYIQDEINQRTGGR